MYKYRASILNCDLPLLNSESEYLLQIITLLVKYLGLKCTLVTPNKEFQVTMIIRSSEK
jgi:hypothetical protein